ncbi:MAG: hypothetical protein R3E04_11450 [Sphingobium sp.]
MLPLFVLASVTRCVSAQLCPTDAEILAAVRSRDGDAVYAISDQEQRDHPGQLIFVHTERIKRIKDVICGDELPGDVPTITCKFTVRYWSRNAYHVARMQRIDGEWRIDDALAVTRKHN